MQPICVYVLERILNVVLKFFLSCANDKKLVGHFLKLKNENKLIFKHCVHIGAMRVMRTVQNETLCETKNKQLTT